LKIAIQAQPADAEVIRELLSPWKISFTSLDEAEVVVVYKEKPLEAKKTVVIPSDSADFMTWVKDVKLRGVRKLGEPVFIAASSQTVLSVNPEMLYYYDGLVKSAPENNPPTANEIDENLFFLTVDVVKECNKILDETLNAKPSTAYRLLTGLPVPYTIAPKKLRDLFMRGHGGRESLTFCDKLPLDALRFILVRAIERSSGKKLQRKTWNGKRYACLVTHDVDTREGLQRARHIKKLEEKYDIPSAWYIPSKGYKLNLETIKGLASYGEVGAHGTRHDGKLVRLPEQKLVRRLREARQTLEKIINCSVKGFRAPLLQHSPRVFRGLKEANYDYDTSIPTWEPKHPRTMRSHGLGTTYPMFFGGVTEIPISVVQDHQLLYALGLEPKKAIAEWFSMMAVIQELGGCCVLLSHPEYKLFGVNNLAVYEELLNNIMSDEQAWLATPKQLADKAGK
jgi:peptidoglycan/xylan/chitin deacetylase (PgdA/CDA1 family)